MRANIAIFVLANLPSFLMSAFLARSVLAAAAIGGATKLAVIVFLLLLGAAANLTWDEHLLSLLTTTVGGAACGLFGFGSRYLIENRSNLLNAGGVLIMIALSTLPTAAYIFGLWTDAHHSRIAYFVAGLLFPPLAIIRGFLIYFGIL